MCVTKPLTDRACLVMCTNYKSLDTDPPGRSYEFGPIFHYKSNRYKSPNNDKRHLKMRTNPAINVMMNTTPQTKA